MSKKEKSYTCTQSRAFKRLSQCKKEELILMLLNRKSPSICPHYRNPLIGMKVVYNQKYMKKGVWKDEIKTKIPECGYFEITDVLFMGGAGILVKLDAGIHSTWELNLNWLEPYTEENQ